MLDKVPNEILLNVLNKCHKKETLENIAKLNLFYKLFIDKYKLFELHANVVRLDFQANRRGAPIKCVMTMEGVDESVTIMSEINRPRSAGDMLCEALKKFCSVTLLTITSSEEHKIKIHNSFLRGLRRLDTKIRRINLPSVDLELMRKDFVEFCKNFEVVNIYGKTFYSNTLRDQELVRNWEVMSVCQLNLLENMHPNTGDLEISDKIIDAMISGITPSEFTLTGSNHITAMGIRRLVEHAIENKLNIEMTFGTITKELCVQSMREIDDWSRHVIRNRATLSYDLIIGHIDNYDEEQKRLIAVRLNKV